MNMKNSVSTLAHKHIFKVTVEWLSVYQLQLHQGLDTF